MDSLHYKMKQQIIVLKVSELMEGVESEKKFSKQVRKKRRSEEKTLLAGYSIRDISVNNNIILKNNIGIVSQKSRSRSPFHFSLPRTLFFTMDWELI